MLTLSLLFVLINSLPYEMLCLEILFRPAFTASTHRPILCVCISLPALPIVHQNHCSRFQIYTLTYNICFSLSDVLHSI